MTVSEAPFSFNPVNLDFHLSDDLIAQEPLPNREDARLMVLNRTNQSIRHERFGSLRSLLKPSDVLVVNTTKVMRAKLVGRKPTGGRVEVLMVAPTSDPCEWRCLVRPEMKPGTRFTLTGGTEVTHQRRNEWGENILRFQGLSGQDVMDKEGRVPLPPYIKRELADRRAAEDQCFYQTVYADAPGSVAAPTAGLHFTKELLTDLTTSGVKVADIVLHVGWGTFKPIATNVDSHVMLPEHYEIADATFQTLREAHLSKRRIFAVGTTVTRVLESLSPDDDNPVLKGETSLFIKPGFQFRWISGLITNFHVPRSTPISLTAAFSGRTFLEKAYETAIQEKYRFFSYGDAMVIV